MVFEHAIPDETVQIGKTNDMTVANELRLLQKKAKDGVLKPEQVIQWAKDNPKSALHKAIEWDDSKAAEEYRLNQVRRLIVVHVRAKDGQQQLISLSIDRTTKGGGYRAVADVMNNQTMRQVALDDALSELERVREKYEWLTELANVWKEADKIRSKKQKKAA